VSVSIAASKLVYKNIASGHLQHLFYQAAFQKIFNFMACIFSD